MSNPMSSDQQRLADVVGHQRVAMLTRPDGRGGLQAKPMHLLELDGHGDFWFFCEADPGDADPSAAYRVANLAFSDEGASRYVAINCRGEVLRDQARIAALWTPLAKPWFPDGPTSPRLACLRLTPLQAELWDGPGNGLSRALALAASVIAGKPVGMGEHQVLDDLATSHRFATPQQRPTP